VVVGNGRNVVTLRHAPVHRRQRGAGVPATPIAPEAREDRRRQAVIAALRATLVERGYHATTYDVVARRAGVRPADIGRLSGSKSELVLEALGLPRLLRGAGRLARLGGAEIVAEYLRFWETDDNAEILLGVLDAALSDRRVVRDVEGFLTRALIRPLAVALGMSDACPRVRLLISCLSGLAVSRYVLREEPLASADHETIAAWVGPAIDGYLHGELGAA